MAFGTALAGLGGRADVPATVAPEEAVTLRVRAHSVQEEILAGRCVCSGRL